MGRPKGSKNKSKEIITSRYCGYFLTDNGLKIPIDMDEQEGGEEFELLANAQYPFDDDSIIWLGENGDLQLRAKRILGWYILKIENE